ncbi:3-dehydroquinate synthase [Gehongia tenuis]|uniref:3-dehydroquinate synthase n=1 Tax=Gehongia tenuis TaxID=2763655 RepID=A0A926D5J8_9FIRM|nr:3-dehydroquinate synthase [Gehongia tenuis]MBC8531284.1 3-dehydroquinate synthase [Gehongia tenuis]
MKLEVRLPQRGYAIHLKKGILDGVGELLRQTFQGPKVLIATDSNVAPLYGERVRNSLERAGYATQTFVFAAGEASKNMNTLMDVYGVLADGHFTRSDAVLALGGGVVGDLSGLAAATYLRGIRFYQVPTTLLAQIDSSVGGKVAVDLPQGKNLVGNFYQPGAVFIDPDTLSTLPEAEVLGGFGEAVKHGAIMDENYFARMEGYQTIADLLKDSEKLIEGSLRVKIGMVEQDERDTGARMALNFGHTLGHALEAATGFDRYIHGIAVAWGMAAVARGSVAMGWMKAEDARRLNALLERFHMIPEVNLSLDDLMGKAASDKKNFGGTLTLVVVPELGKHEFKRLSLEELRRFTKEALPWIS